MSKITAEEFKNLWGSGDDIACCAFQLSEAEIQEWIKHGKFSKIKEYCQGMPYEVKFTCLKPTSHLAKKKFGFVFQNRKDEQNFLVLVDKLRALRSCVKVEQLSFQELENEDPVDSGGTLMDVVQEYCPLVI